MDEGDDEYFQSASHAEQMMLKMDAYFDKQQVLLIAVPGSKLSFTFDASLMLIFASVLFSLHFPLLVICFFTAQCYASTVLHVVVCLFVRPSIRVSVCYKLVLYQNGYT